MLQIVEKRKKMKELAATEKVLEKVKEAFKNVQTGVLTQAELEDLVDNAHALYERALILRYKAYESKVFGKDISEIIQPNVEEEKVVVDVKKEEEKPVAKDEPEVQVLSNPTPTIDFSIFDDLEPVDSKNIPEEIIIEVKPIEKPVEPIAEQKSIFEEIEPIATHVDLFQKMKQKSDAPFMNSKLESLIGAFGFAQKLQIVNELFAGSQEAFANFVEEADLKATRDDANIHLHKSVQLHKMSTDSDAFVQLVLTYERKYV
jgi:hypothetical protein